VSVFLLIVTILGFVGAARSAFGSGPDNLNWELRWQGLDSDDRARISTDARADPRHSSLTGPEEAELAAGLRRRDRRRRAYVELAVLPFVLIVVVLALFGLINAGSVGLLIGLSVVFTGLWDYLWTRRMSGEPRPATSPEAGL
jgi:hypothetical protein